MSRSPDISGSPSSSKQLNRTHSSKPASPQSNQPKLTLSQSATSPPAPPYEAQPRPERVPSSSYSPPTSYLSDPLPDFITYSEEIIAFYHKFDNNPRQQELRVGEVISKGMTLAERAHSLKVSDEEQLRADLKDLKEVTKAYLEQRQEHLREQAWQRLGTRLERIQNRIAREHIHRSYNKVTAKVAYHEQKPQKPKPNATPKETREENHCCIVM